MTGQASVPPPAGSVPTRTWPRPAQVASIFAAALVATMLLYALFSAPGRWFSDAPRLEWPAAKLTLTRGTGALAGGELHISGPDSSGLVLLSADTGFRSTDYPVVAWAVSDVPPGADVRLLWRSDYTPGKVSSVGLVVDSGRLLPVALANNGEWIGTIRGLALAIHNAGTEPIRVRGVVAKPAGPLGIANDRVAEWLAFEPWSGTSINSVTGGADVQDLPLPLLLAVAAAVACGALALLARRLGVAPRHAVAAGLAGSVLLGWALLDARWGLNLARQVIETAGQYGGKDYRGKHRAAEDAALFDFIERARAAMPSKPARVFVVAEAHYFRGRAAFHLYPHNVYFDPYHDALPPAGQLHAGDWVLVYKRRGVQYDAARHRLRLGGPEVPAELKLVDAGAALFLVVAP